MACQSRILRETAAWFAESRIICDDCDSAGGMARQTASFETTLEWLAKSRIPCDDGGSGAWIASM
jgi:hypothetical protein